MIGLGFILNLINNNTLPKLQFSILNWITVHSHRICLHLNFPSPSLLYTCPSICSVTTQRYPQTWFKDIFAAKVSFLLVFRVHYFKMITSEKVPYGTYGWGMWWTLVRSFESSNIIDPFKHVGTAALTSFRTNTSAVIIYREIQK